MTIDGKVPTDEDSDQQAVVAVPQPVSTATMIGYGLLGALLIGWFLFGALVQRQGLLDSAGESLGAASALLLAVSIIAAVRGSRR
jgi:hypothetical protein